MNDSHVGLRERGPESEPQMGANRTGHKEIPREEVLV